MDIENEIAVMLDEKFGYFLYNEQSTLIAKAVYDFFEHILEHQIAMIVDLTKTVQEMNLDCE